MSATVRITIDGQPRIVKGDVTVAVALLQTGQMTFRRDATGHPRAPLCGMGTCFECRVTIDGVAGSRACLVPVAEGMVVETAP